LGGGLDAQGGEVATRAWVEFVDRVDRAFDALGAALVGLVGERVGETLDGMAGRDGKPVQMQLAMDLCERHRTVVARQHCEGSGAQMLAVKGLRVAGDGRDRRRAAAPGDAEALHDVFGIDARPEHHPHLRELRANLGQLVGERALRGVELGGLFQ
jgi:hypothetical protein